MGWILLGALILGPFNNFEPEKKILNFWPKVPTNCVFELQLSPFSTILGLESNFENLQTKDQKSVLLYLLGTYLTIKYCHMATSLFAVLQIVHING